MSSLLPENISIKDNSFLITGGAGFIGSNLVEFLLLNGAKKVRVLDNLATGNINNINEFYSHPNFQFIEGDIRDLNACEQAIKEIDFVSHQAALGSVPRSINDPITTNSVNVDGFLNILKTAKDFGVKRLIYASSSSVYGDIETSPKIEGVEGNVMSPYALTKKMNEEYAKVFSSVYGFHTIGLRYFNVFGPKQNPEGDYAAVIPRFIMHAINGTAPTIYGDGHQARDFTYVENAVQANIKALYINEKIKDSQVYNVACGASYSIMELWEEISNRFSNSKNPNYEKPRNGDVRNSLASLERSTSILKYYPSVNLKTGLEKTIDFYKKNIF